MTDHKPLTVKEEGYCESITDYRDAVRSAVMGFIQEYEEFIAREDYDIPFDGEWHIKEWFSVFFEEESTDGEK